MEHISNGGSIQTRTDIPEWVKEVYVTSADISPEAHVGMQSAFQQSCDSGISKTINFSNEASIEDVYTAYMLAWESGCKGITVYRAGSREKEVLVKAESPEREVAPEIETIDFLQNLSETPFLSKEHTLDECCGSPIIVEESGCSTCKNCGWSKCHIA